MTHSSTIAANETPAPIPATNVPSRTEVVVATGVYAMGAAFSALIAAYAVYGRLNPSHGTLYYSLYGVSGVLLIGLFVCATRLEAGRRVVSSKWVLMAAVSLFSTETYLEFVASSRSENYFKTVVELNGFQWDDRSIHEVVADLRRRGVGAYPIMGGLALMGSDGLITDNGRIFPLGGISSRPTVMDKITYGNYPTAVYDEHGFNNPKGLYQKDKLDVVITGNCTIEYAGTLDPTKDNIGQALRDLGLNSINLGKEGSEGLLLQYAILKEYAEPLRPKVVLISYYPGDERVGVSTQSPTMMRYLNDSTFSQNLIKR